MAKLVTSDLSNFNSSGLATHNANLDAIEAAMELTLSRDGTNPNAMEANLDMNSHRIYNLPAPVDPTEVVRLADIEEILENQLDTNDITVATEDQAEAGLSNVVMMTPLRTAQAIDAQLITSLAQQVPSMILDHWAVTESPRAGWLGMDYSESQQRLVMVGGTGSLNGIATSDDGGRNWIERTMPADKQWADAIWIEDLGLWVICAIGAGPDTQRMATSPDGEAWTLRTTPDLSFRGLAWNGTRIVAIANDSVVGSTNRVATSTDGITWVQGSYSFAEESWTSITWVEDLNMFIVTAVSVVEAPVMTSPDGLVWTQRTNGAAEKHVDENWQAAAWSPELEILVIAKNTGTNAIPGDSGSIVNAERFMFSSDGITYEPCTAIEGVTLDIGADLLVSFHDVKWITEFGQFVAIGNTGSHSSVFSSLDGDVWQPRWSNQEASWQDLTWCPDFGTLVACGDRTTPTPEGRHVMFCSIGQATEQRAEVIGTDALIFAYADTTTVNNSTTLTDVGGLTRRFKAGQDVRMEATIRYDSATAADFKITVTSSGSATVTGRWGLIPNGRWTGDTWTRTAATTFGTAITMDGTGAGAFHLIKIWAIAEVAQNGVAATDVRDTADIAIQFAQATQDVSDTRVSSDSHAMYFASRS